MNIFALDTDPKPAAQYHVSKHVVKMILEHTQLLSTAHRLLDGTMSVIKSKSGRNQKSWILSDLDLNSVLYSATHVNHPSAVWARQSKARYDWLLDLTMCLCDEYTFRYGKVHKCERDVLPYLIDPPKNIPMTSDFTYPSPAMPEYCVVPDVIQSYRNYYNNEKQRMFDWSGPAGSRNIPDWIVT